MTRILKISIFLLATFSISPLGALSFGGRINLGLTTGTGGEWWDTLEEAGDRRFNEVRPTVGIGGFIEMDISSFIFAPELNYAVNRGTAMGNSQDQFIRTSAIHSLEMILPLAYDFIFNEEKKAFRVMGGFQLLYSFNLQQAIKITNDEETHTDLKNLSPFSMGFVLGSGIEFRKQKKMSWFLDARIIIPFSDRITYTLSNGSEQSYKTIEFLLGSGIKF
jgi:hypothetical protein